MIEIQCKPEIHSLATCREFAEVFKPGPEDIILTNKYIYEPFFGDMDLPARRIYQEEYGSGEPTDVMVNAILETMENLPCRRLFYIP